MDATTSGEIAALTLCLTGFFLAWTWLAQRSSVALLWWSLGFLCSAFAALAHTVSVASLSVPAWIGPTYDLLTILAYTFILHGFRRFNGRTGGLITLMSAPAVYLLALALVPQMGGRASDLAIVVSLSLILASTREVWLAEPRGSLWRFGVLVLCVLNLAGNGVQLFDGAEGDLAALLSDSEALEVFLLMRPVIFGVAFGFSLLGMSLEQDNARLRRAALADPLTGTLNRRGASAWLGAQRTRWPVVGAQPRTYLAALVVDIDHFKRVNDTYGHGIGDAALLVMADRLRANSRPGDAVVRLGGEEFAILMPSISAPDAFEAGERIRRAVAAEKFDLGSVRLNLTVSMGYAVLRNMPSEDELVRLITEADLALYRAKQSGRNRIVAADPVYLVPA